MSVFDRFLAEAGFPPKKAGAGTPPVGGKPPVAGKKPNVPGKPPAFGKKSVPPSGEPGQDAGNLDQLQDLNDGQEQDPNDPNADPNMMGMDPLAAQMQQQQQERERQEAEAAAAREAEEQAEREKIKRMRMAADQDVAADLDSAFNDEHDHVIFYPSIDMIGAMANGASFSAHLDKKMGVGEKGEEADEDGAKGDETEGVPQHQPNKKYTDVDASDSKGDAEEDELMSSEKIGRDTIAKDSVGKHEGDPRDDEEEDEDNGLAIDSDDLDFDRDRDRGEDSEEEEDEGKEGVGPDKIRDDDAVTSPWGGYISGPGANADKLKSGKGKPESAELKPGEDDEEGGETPLEVQAPERPKGENDDGEEAPVKFARDEDDEEADEHEDSDGESSKRNAFGDLEFEPEDEDEDGSDEDSEGEFEDGEGEPDEVEGEKGGGSAPILHDTLGLPDDPFSADEFEKHDALGDLMQKATGEEGDEDNPFADEDENDEEAEDGEESDESDSEGDSKEDVKVNPSEKPKQKKRLSDVLDMEK